MKLFAGNIANLTDARYFAAWNVDWMGFNLDKSRGEALNAEKMRAIMEWVEGPQVVLEMGPVSTDDLSSAKEIFSCRYFKLSPLQDPAHIHSEGLYLCPTAVYTEKSDPGRIAAFFDKWKDLASAYVLDLDKNSVPPKVIESDFIRSLNREYRIFLAWPLARKFDPELVASAGFYGLYVGGGDEEKTGVKSYQTLDDILESVKEPFS